MKNLTCRNCGGTMVFDASSLKAECLYCGCTYLLDHEDTDYYAKHFQQMKEFFLSDATTQARKRNADAFWQSASHARFETTDGNVIDVSYMHHFTESDAEVYVARRNIIYHFTNAQTGAQLAELFRQNVSAVDYPTADTRALADFFPRINGGFVLTDGTHLLVLNKHEDEYPLRLFGQLPSRHVAWLISRMENLCCVLEYNSTVHPELTMDNLYINPYTHQVCIYGGWWKVCKNRTYDVSCRQFLTTQQNLTQLRTVAARLLGFSSAELVRPNYPNADSVGSGLPAEKETDIPQAMAAFIANKPRVNAYEDFSYWDEMLLKAYGQRKFIHYATDDQSVYE